MNILGTIMSRIFQHPMASGPQADQETPVTGGTPFDVEGALADMASKKGEKLNYMTSVVDLLKVLDLDSSLEARKALATELHVEAGPAGSAEENAALSKAVMQKLAETGGKLPAGL